MKKLSKFLSVIACALIVVVSGAALAGCGGNKPYSVKGVKLTGTAECTVVWGDSATQQDKDELWGQLDATNNEEFEQNMSEMAKEFYEASWFDFKKDGTFTAYMDESEQSGYYVQSEDLKTITLYRNAEHTQAFSGFVFEYIDGAFRLNTTTDGDYDVSIYFAYKKA